MAKFRISYNAPVVLTFALVSVVVRLLGDDITVKWFTSHGNLDGAAAWLSLFTHIIGHANWDHLIANFMLILLLGPILEERFGSVTLLVMILVTGLISGMVDVVLGDRTLGASGIAFMMILLASTANIRQGEIPLTFIAVAVIYLGSEVMKAFNDDNISQLGHILGGVTGAVFGFLLAKNRAAHAPVKTALPGAPAAALKPKPKI